MPHHSAHIAVAVGAPVALHASDLDVTVNQPRQIGAISQLPPSRVLLENTSVPVQAPDVMQREPDRSASAHTEAMHFSNERPSDAEHFGRMQHINGRGITNEVLDVAKRGHSKY